MKEIFKNFHFRIIAMMVIILSLATAMVMYVPNSKSRPLDSEACSKPLVELLRDNTESLYVGLYISQYRREKPPTWYVKAESKDKEFKFEVEDEGLCETLKKAWTRIEYYNAYASRDYHKD